MDTARYLVSVLVQGFVFVLVAVVSYRALGELAFERSPRVLLAGAVAGLAAVGAGEVLRGDYIHFVVLPATALAFSLLALLLLFIVRALPRARRRTERRGVLPPVPRGLRERAVDKEERD